MSLLDGPTFEERFHELRPGLYRRLRRDLRCAAYLGAFFWRYAIFGAKVRRKYKACEASGEPFWLDPPGDAE